MAYGAGSEAPVLTIAIPTWNRSKSLARALQHLLPQVAKYPAEIEIVISDNGSEDDTQAIIKECIETYHFLKIILNKNQANLGFYGNLKICRELSSAKYFWVLSDDDYVQNDIIETILNQLKVSPSVAVIYLKNKKQTGFINHNLDRNRLLLEETYNIGLISSVIFLNNKEFDPFLYNRYSNSAFLGFILMLNSFNYSKEVVVIEGYCLNVANDTSKGINFFEIFINHMQHVIDYMHFLKIEGRIINKFRCSYLVYFIRRYYILFKAEKHLRFNNFENSHIKEIDLWIYQNYADLRCYWLRFYYVKFIPDFFLNSILKTRRLLKN